MARFELSFNLVTLPRILNLFLIQIALTVFVFQCQAEATHKIVAVQSVKTDPYGEAFEGFEKALSRNADIEKIILSDFPEEKVREKIKTASPDLLLAIGIGALSLLKDFEDLPIVYVMVLDGAYEFSTLKHITGVDMYVEPETQLEILLEAIPGTRTIGLLHDPERTGRIAENIHSAAAQKKVKLIDGQVYRAENVPSTAMEMRNKIDVFWMLPDLTVLTPETFEFLLFMAVESDIPILTFSEKYVEQGALLSIGVDPSDMGRQAGEIADRILSGADVSSIPSENARKAVLSINAKVAQKLKIPFDEQILNQKRMKKVLEK